MARSHPPFDLEGRRPSCRGRRSGGCGLVCRRGTRGSGSNAPGRRCAGRRSRPSDFRGAEQVIEQHADLATRGWIALLRSFVSHID
jgi:hypothetical protein